VTKFLIIGLLCSFYSRGILYILKIVRQLIIKETRNFLIRLNISERLKESGSLKSRFSSYRVILEMFIVLT
jgi:hypothetical protein